MRRQTYAKLLGMGEVVGVEVRIISGMMVGLEFIKDRGKNVLVVDLLIIRLLVFLL